MSSSLRYLSFFLILMNLKAQTVPYLARTQNCSPNRPMRQFSLTPLPARSSVTLRMAFFVAAALSVGVSLVGCFRDPNTRKQRFVAEGDRYATQQKYSEALITYGRALQIDPKSADVHYKIAKCHLKLANWSLAYRELQRTVDLDPQNWSAQLDLGALYLVGGKPADAKNEALTILKSSPDDLGAQLLLANADAQLNNMQDALREAANAVRMAPNNPDPYVPGWYSAESF